MGRVLSMDAKEHNQSVWMRISYDYTLSSRKKEAKMHNAKNGRSLNPSAFVFVD
jgi:hypothetical protein